jgi:hypothetical protein
MAKKVTEYMITVLLVVFAKHRKLFKAFGYDNMIWVASNPKKAIELWIEAVKDRNDDLGLEFSLTEDDSIGNILHDIGKTQCEDGDVGLDRILHKGRKK